MTILHIDSSISGENSASRTLTSSIVNQLKAASRASGPCIATSQPTRCRI